MFSVPQWNDILRYEKPVIVIIQLIVFGISQSNYMKSNQIIKIIFVEIGRNLNFEESSMYKIHNWGNIDNSGCFISFVRNDNFKAYFIKNNYNFCGF